MMTFVSSVKSVLFNSEHQFIYKSVRKKFSNFPFLLYHENSIDSNPIKFTKKWKKLKTKDLFDDPQDLEFVKNFPRGESYWNQNACFWYRKIISLRKAKKATPEGLLVWCDCDLNLLRRFTRKELDRMKAHDVCFIKRKGRLPETGLICFNLSKAGGLMIDRMSDFYTSGAFKAFERWDDCQAFEHCKNTSPDLKFASFTDITKLKSLIFHAKGPFAEIRMKE